MKKLLSLMVLLMLFSFVVQGKIIYLVRHAEKVDDGSKDPELTVQGHQRAENIADMLSQANIKHVYATDYQRTQLTAKPLADFLGISVNSYDPGQLSGFAEQLKQQTGNALVVGHSNTTPMLTYLLSNNPVINLDETDFDNVFQVNIEGEQVSLNILKSSPSKATQKLSQFKPKTNDFFSGELVFNMLYKGEVVGQSKQAFDAKDETYLLSKHTQVESMNINADISATVKIDSLLPASLSMTGSMGGPVDIQLTWHNEVVKGHSNMARDGFKQQGKIELNQALRSHSFDRTSTIMLAHLLPVSAGHPLLINWLNGHDADQRLIEITYHGEEQITVPAGTFETYKIEYSGGAPSQYFWIDKNQAKVVKIEVIKSPWLYELLSFKIDS